MSKALKKKISNGIKNKTENGQWTIMSPLDTVLPDQELCHAKRREKPQICSVYQSLVLRMKTSLMTEVWLLMGRQSHKSFTWPALFFTDFWTCGFLGEEGVLFVGGFLVFVVLFFFKMGRLWSPFRAWQGEEEVQVTGGMKYICQTHLFTLRLSSALAEYTVIFQTWLSTVKPYIYWTLLISFSELNRSSKCAANCYTKGIQITGSVTIFSFFSI